jgi:hypothetical protein
MSKVDNKPDPKWDKVLNILSNWQNSFCEIKDREKKTTFICTLDKGFEYISNHQRIYNGTTALDIRLIDPENKAVKILYGKKGLDSD